MATEPNAFSSLDLLVEATGGPRMRLASTLRDLVHVLNILVERDLRAEADSLPYPYLRILDALEQRPRSSGRQLARAVVVTPQTVGTILTRLEQAGLVIRAPHEENRRADRWSLTDRGAEKCQALRRAVEASLAQALSGLTRRQISDIAECIGLLSRTVLMAGERSGAL